jgi:mono/diheme cytochrome c family protein
MFPRLMHAQLAAWCCLVTVALASPRTSGDEPLPAPLPSRLSETGLYVAGSATEVRPDNIPFSPQYPLWSDGATKRRWLHIPPGAFIDASRPDGWDFPRGTKLWKEFSHGRRVETRLIQRLADGTWAYATYVWNEEGTQAALAPAEGIRALPVDGAPAGRYPIPAELDCRACHEGAAVPVLGVSALQLSPDRDPLAPHAEPLRPGDADLNALIARGWVRNLPAALRDRAPRIATPSPESRAALGYLHGNCGHCHNADGSPPPVDLVLARSAAATEKSYENILGSLVGVLSRYRAPGLRAGAPLIDAGRPETSVLTARMRSRDPRMQMPPLATQVVDTEALGLIERWIRNQPGKELHP